MHGRTCSCLLAVWVLALAAPVLLHSRLLAQAHDDNPAVRALKPSQAFVAGAASASESDASTPPPFLQSGSDSRREISFPVRPPARFPIRPAPVGIAQVTRAAGSIFSGTVISIAPAAKSNVESLESVAITFHVERSLRGVRTGQQLTIVQWMGTWRSGQRYQVGERVLLFLYPASRLGLTSSVAGPLGRFTVDAAGQVVLSQQQYVAFQSDLIQSDLVQPHLNAGGKLCISLDDFFRSVQRVDAEEGALR